MKIIQWPRRSGKTSHLVNWLRQNPDAVLVVMHASEQQRLVRTYDLKRDQVLLPHECAHRLRGREVKLAVDQLDHVLGALLGQMPIIATLDAEG